MKAKKVLTPEEKAELVRHSRHRHLATDLMLIFCSTLFVVLFCYLETHLPHGVHIGHRTITATTLADWIHGGTGLSTLAFGGSVAKSYCYHIHAIRKTRIPGEKVTKTKGKLTPLQKAQIKTLKAQYEEQLNKLKHGE